MFWDFLIRFVDWVDDRVRGFDVRGSTCTMSSHIWTIDLMSEVLPTPFE